MPDVSPGPLRAARRAWRRIYGEDPDAKPAWCGLCHESIDAEKELYQIAVNGVWVHIDCIRDDNYGGEIE